MKGLLFLFTCFVFTKLQAKEVSETFIVQIFDQYIKVISPSKYHKKMSIIVENKMLSNQIVKIETEKNLIARLTAFAQSSTSKDIFINPEDKLYLVPISPPFETVYLEIGKGSYEVPEKNRR